jgi:hypothetical protein
MDGDLGCLEDSAKIDTENEIMRSLEDEDKFVDKVTSMRGDNGLLISVAHTTTATSTAHSRLSLMGSR